MCNITNYDLSISKKTVSQEHSPNSLHAFNEIG